MKCKTSKQSLIAVVVIGIGLTGFGLATAQNPRDAIESLRTDLKADRKAVIAEEMKLTDQESQAFWPLYRSYRAEVEKVNDRIAELVLEYADLYPNVPEQKASEMLSQHAKIEADLLGVKQKYLKKFGKVLPPSKVFRFAQLDNRFDLGVRVGLAATIPLLPVSQAQPADQKH
jgi:hypothetical protein